MTVDVSKLREGLRVGDLVTLRARIVENPTGLKYGLCAVMGAGLNPVNVEHLDIVSVEPRPLKVGDRVKAHGIGVDDATVLCLDGEHAWINHKGGHLTANIKSLSRSDTHSRLGRWSYAMHILKPLAELFSVGIFMAGFMGSALVLSDTVRPSLPLVALMGGVDAVLP